MSTRTFVLGDSRLRSVGPAPTIQTSPLEVGVPGHRMTIVDFVIAVIIAMAIVGILLYTKSDAQD